MERQKPLISNLFKDAKKTGKGSGYSLGYLLHVQNYDL